MKATGNIRRMEDNTIEIPEELQNIVGIENNQSFEFFVDYDEELEQQVLIIAPLPIRPKASARIQMFMEIARNLRKDLLNDFNDCKTDDNTENGIMDTFDDLVEYIEDNYDLLS